MKSGYVFVIAGIWLFGCQTNLIVPETGGPDDPPSTTDLIISEVRVTSGSEDGFRNTYFEVYNGIGVDVDLSNYAARYASNGNNGSYDETTQLVFSGSLPNGEVIVIAREGTNPDLVVNPDFVWNALTANGDDAIGLFKNSGNGFELIDQYGEPYTDEGNPGNSWNVAGIAGASRNTVLLRKYQVSSPNANWTFSASINEIGSEWSIRDFQDYSNLGSFTPNTADYDPTQLFQTIDIEGLNFNYYSNLNLANSVNTGDYTNLLMFIHGGSLDGFNHFVYAIEAVDQLGLVDNTVVVAPQFQDEDTNGNYFFGQFSWKDGNTSRNAGNAISSFAVLDTLIRNYALRNYPNIQNIVLAGHSAGGQCIYRYALLSSLPDDITQEVNYLPMNPSSYAYIGPERWNGSAFTVPSSSGCPDYNSWNYGLDNLSSNQYRPSLTSTEVRNAFPTRRLTYTIGTEDLDSSDTGCEANLMGAQRFERGVLAFDFITFAAPANNHAKIEVDGVDHDADRMINSTEVINYLSNVFE